jgi:hypothetical protein
MERSELEILLSKYRLTFNWGEPANKWWLVGQEKGSNVLKRTDPQPAKDRDAALIAATEYIKSRFK